MQVSAKQIKLARILLGWTQPELGQQAGVSKDTIINLETGRTVPLQNNLDKIIKALEDGGVEFLEGNGVKERQVYIQHYHGIEGFREYMDDVYETARIHGGDICLFNSKPSLWMKYLGKDWCLAHSQRMAELGNKIRVRITAQSGEKEFIIGSAEHRWLTKDKWREKIFYAYGPKIGFLDFSDDTINITVIEEADFAESLRIMFNAVWEHETVRPDAA